MGDDEIMNKIVLNSEGISDVTLVSNTFIELFMPSANGSYVKVYLYLLRCFQGNCPELTISSIADHLDNTENDIIRALHYWEKLGAVRLTYSESKKICSINLTELSSPNNTSNVINYAPADDEPAITLNTDDTLNTEDKKTVSRPSYSKEQISSMSDNEGLKWIMHIVELYLNKPLKQVDMQLILYLYEDLNFSPELIMYLYEYCVDKGKKNTSYIEAVALTWAEKNIDSEDKARAETAAFSQHVIAVNKAFGLNRAPGQIERDYITRWVNDFGFSDEIITEACNRTLLRTGKPDFKYADKVLETWFKKGVKSEKDIEKTDEEFKKNYKKPNSGKVTSIKKSNSNKFNQFPQRNYTDKDYAELERKLLNKGL